MERASDAASFVRDPIGRWTATPTLLAWVASRSLCGIAAWGRPTPEEAARNVAIFEGLYALQEPADLVMDGTGFESVDLEALGVLLDWSRRHLAGMQTHFRRRIGLIPTGAVGLVLAGLSPVLGWMTGVAIASDLRSALRKLDAPDSESLAIEIETLARSLRDTPTVVLELRALLRARNGDVSLAEATSALHVSARSLQRVLAAEGRSFRAEEQDARFEALTRILASTDDKIAAIARRLGVTETALGQLVRARTGIGVSEYRQRIRGGP